MGAMLAFLGILFTASSNASTRIWSRVHVLTKHWHDKPENHFFKVHARRGPKSLLPTSPHHQLVISSPLGRPIGSPTLVNKNSYQGLEAKNRGLVAEI